MCPEISGLAGKYRVARKPRIIFQSPEILKKSFLFIFMGIFTNFDKYIHQKRENFIRIWVL